MQCPHKTCPPREKHVWHPCPDVIGDVLTTLCRGKVSEGLDFSDRAGRAVVITGIPFANSRDAKVDSHIANFGIEAWLAMILAYLPLQF